MKKQLTAEEYIAEGAGKCPFCLSDDIVGESVEVSVTEAWQEIECQNCGAVWQNIYKLVAVDIIQEPAEK